jgi:hypothetical protein
MPQSATYLAVGINATVTDVKPPKILYEAVLLRSDEDGIIYQAGAFATEAEAQEVLDILQREGRSEPMAINVVGVYDSVDQWQADR